MAEEEEVAKLVVGHDCGMCKASFASDDALHSVLSGHDSGMCKPGSLGEDAVSSGMCKTGSPSAEMDHKDSNVGDEAQTKRRKCSLLGELDIIYDLQEWLESAC